MISKINILGVEYTVQEVEVVNKEEPRRGEVNLLTNIIKLDKEMPLSLKNQTLMHEILHAVFDLLGMDDLSNDESKVQAIAVAIYYIFSTQKIFEEKENA